MHAKQYANLDIAEAQVYGIRCHRGPYCWHASFTIADVTISLDRHYMEDIDKAKQAAEWLAAQWLRGVGAHDVPVVL